MSDITDRLDALEAAAKDNQLPSSFAALQRKLEQNWQPDAAVLLQSGSVTAAALATNVPFKSVRGVVTGAGAVSYGSGFTAVRNAAGDYTITFTTAFAQAPVVTLTNGTDAVNAIPKLKNGVAPTGSAFSVYTLTTAGANIDAQFHFTAEERS